MESAYRRRPAGSRPPATLPARLIRLARAAGTSSEKASSWSNPQAGEGGAHPDEHEDGHRQARLQQEPQPAQPAIHRPFPATRNRVVIDAEATITPPNLGSLDHGELDAAVFGVITGDKLGLRLRHVEGCTVQLRRRSGHEDKEGQRLHDYEGQRLGGNDVSPATSNPPASPRPAATPPPAPRS